MKTKQPLVAGPNVSRIVFAATAAVFFVFTAANVRSSQDVSPLLPPVAANNPQAVSSYLSHIRRIPVFPEEYRRLTAEVDPKIGDTTTKEESLKRKEVAELETILQANPNARDVLVALSTLEEALGDNQAAQMYFNRAKEIDPQL